MPRPDDHRCSERTIDYSKVEEGYLVCVRDNGGCGREWRHGSGGWSMYPFTRQPRG